MKLGSNLHCIPGMFDSLPLDDVHEDSSFRLPGKDFVGFGVIRLRQNTLQLAAGMISLR